MIGLPERFSSTVAPARAASALGGTGTHTSSQTSACSDEPGHVGGAEEQVRPERYVDPVALQRQPDPLPPLVVPGREVPSLVELPVVR